MSNLPSLMGISILPSGVQAISIGVPDTLVTRSSWKPEVRAACERNGSVPNSASEVPKNARERSRRLRTFKSFLGTRLLESNGDGDQAVFFFVTSIEFLISDNLLFRISA